MQLRVDTSSAVADVAVRDVAIADVAIADVAASRVSASRVSAQPGVATNPDVQRPLFSKLESLRGVAACLVAIHHSLFLVGDQSAPFVGSSYLFVDYFFILSGFVITYAYRAKILSGMRFKAYASLRLGRLVPVHVFAHCLYAFSIFGKWLAYLLGIGASNPATWVHVPSFFTNLFLLQAFGVYDYLYWNRPSWSISAELLTYVVFFLLTRTWDQRGRILPPLIGSVALYSALLAWTDRRLDITYDFGLIRCIAGFYAGSALFRLRERFAERSAGNALGWSNQRRSLAEVACLVAVAVSVSHARTSNLWVVGALVAFASSILVFSSKSNGVLGSLLELPLLRKIGVWSFSIYLLHLVCFEVAGNVATYAFGLDLKHGIGAIAWLWDAVTLGVVLVLSRTTYQWIEEPLRNLVKARVTQMDALNESTRATRSDRACLAQSTALTPR